MNNTIWLVHGIYVVISVSVLWTDVSIPSVAAALFLPDLVILVEFVTVKVIFIQNSIKFTGNALIPFGYAAML